MKLTYSVFGIPDVKIFWRRLRVFRVTIYRVPKRSLRCLGKQNCYVSKNLLLIRIIIKKEEYSGRHIFIVDGTFGTGFS